jgi:hypothetical protein
VKAFFLSIMVAVWTVHTATSPAATYVVTATADSGPGSLRQAILDANADTSTNDVSIEFNIPASGAQTIAPLTVLPTISRPVTIDGYTQPGASPNTLASGDNAVLLIELSGANLSSPNQALYVNARGCTLRGLTVNRFQYGIWLFLADDSVVEGNFLGTDTSGMAALANFDCLVIQGANGVQIGGLTPASRNIVGGSGYGIDFFVGGVSNQVLGNYIGLGADGVTIVSNTFGMLLHNTIKTQIGGRAPAARNVISGNANGIWVNNFGPNIFQGNFIGTDASGTLARGNLSGIVLNEAPNSLIGGTDAGAGNLISGNIGQGVVIEGLNATNDVVAGNFIGTDITGTAVMTNGDYGVYVTSSQNLVGGIDASARNVICGSTWAGVAVYGLAATNTSVLGNSIFGNGTGIDLSADFGPTPNDPDDADTGANHYQNFPEISSVKVAGRNLKVDYKVDSAPTNSAYPFAVEFFIADGGQGRTFIHRATYSTPQAVDSITFKPSVLPAVGDKIVATATDSNGNTSEFSAPIAVARNGNGN